MKFLLIYFFLVNIEDIIDKIKVVQPPMREIDPTDYYNYIEFAFD